MRTLVIKEETHKIDYQIFLFFLMGCCFIATANVQLLIAVFPFIYFEETKYKCAFLLSLFILYFVDIYALIEVSIFIIGTFIFIYGIRLLKGNIILAMQFYIAISSFTISYMHTNDVIQSISFFVIQMIFYHELMKSFEWLRKDTRLSSSIYALLCISVVYLLFQYMIDYREVFITLGLIFICFRCTSLISIASFFLLNFLLQPISFELFVCIYVLSLLKDQLWLMILVFLGLFIPQVNNYSQILVLSLYLVFLLLLSKESIQTETDIVKQSNSKSYLHKQLVNFSLIFEHLGTYYENVSIVESNFLKSMSNALNYTSKKCLNNHQSIDFIKSQVLSILEGYEIGYEDVRVEMSEEGFIHIECSLLNFSSRDVREVLLPLLNHLLPTPMECLSTKSSLFQFGVLNVEFISTPPIRIDAYADSIHVKDTCGDSFSIFNHSRNVYCLISDGMGTGYEASKISKCIIHLFQRMIFSNINEIEAMSCINKLLLSDAYATCDVLAFDRFQKTVVICKSAANPTYLIRNSELYVIWGTSLPIGIVAHIEVDHIHVQVEKGDFFIMSSDGVGIEEIIRWMKRSENGNARNETQLFMDVLKENERNDDSTILLAKVV